MSPNYAAHAEAVCGWLVEIAGPEEAIQLGYPEYIGPYWAAQIVHPDPKLEHLYCHLEFIPYTSQEVIVMYRDQDFKWCDFFGGSVGEQAREILSAEGFLDAKEHYRKESF